MNIMYGWVNVSRETFYYGMEISMILCYYLIMLKK